MEAIRIIKIHIPLVEEETDEVLDGFRELSSKYGRKVKIEEVREILRDRFGVE